MTDAGREHALAGITFKRRWGCGEPVNPVTDRADTREERRALADAKRHARRSRDLEKRVRKILMGSSERHIDAIEPALVQRGAIVRVVVELLRWGLRA